MKKLILPLLIWLACSGVYAQTNALCEGADPFCSDNTYNFPMNTNAADAQIGPDYGCLFSQPNPVWYFMQIDQAGTLVIDIASLQGNDVDFICYGPFNTLVGACNNLTAGNTVDCSYSAAAQETCTIPGAVVGQYYLLLLTNFSNMPSDVVFSQSNVGQPGAGSSDCNIVNPNVGNNGPLCEGDTLQLFTDNIPNVTYDWHGPNGFLSSLEDPFRPNVTVADSGIYTCYINGSSFHDTVQTHVVINPNPGGILHNTANCEDRLANFSVTGTQGTIATYAWDFGVPGATSALANPSYTYANTGDYQLSLILTTNAGCTDTLKDDIHIGQTPIPDFTAAPLEGCYPFPVAFTNLTTGTVLTYLWNFGNYATSSAFEPVYTYGNATRLYDVTLTAISPEGCDSSVTKPNYISVHGQPIAGFTYSPTYPDELFNVVNFHNLTALGENFYWDFGDGQSSTSYAPSHQYPADTGTYTVTLYVTSSFGCNDTVSLILHVKPTYTIYIPNSFSPNNDELNEVFQVSGHNIKGVVMDIYDRWGKPIFHQEGMEPVTKGWNGTAQSGGQPLPLGVYTYKITVTDVFNLPHEFMGSINLIR
jgi:gliding motility-associated-like protein